MLSTRSLPYYAGVRHRGNVTDLTDCKAFAEKMSV